MKAFLWVLLLVASTACLGQDTAANDRRAETARWIENARSLRELIRSDPHRPRYHFMVPEGKGTEGDPNGALYWKGKYHLGFIYQKMKDGKSEPVWGHAVSTDLLHWTLYPDMLDVKEGDLEQGIYSGGAFVSKEGVPHLIYYGLGAQANLLAYAADEDLKVWKKISTPALAAGSKDTLAAWSGEGSKYSVFDPDAWYEARAGVYYQISGGMKPALFKSKDLKEWSYLGDEWH